MVRKPETQSSLAEKELDKVEKQLNAFEDGIKELTMDRMNSAPKQESEPQTKIAQKDLDKHNDLYLKPHRSVAARDKFNEAYREEYNFAKEYVQFIAEHKEMAGETIEIWTRPYGGTPAEYWEVPTNVPVWGPRYLAERLNKAQYHRLMMKDAPTERTGAGIMYGQMAVDQTVNRLTAQPVSTRKSIFMGSTF